MRERVFDLASGVEDLFQIWQYIARDSEDAANRVESEFYEIFDALERMPGQGHEQTDLTERRVLFFPLDPIRIVAVIDGRRNVRNILKGRQL